jgi:hypothetical protein
MPTPTLGRPGPSGWPTGWLSGGMPGCRSPRPAPPGPRLAWPRSPRSCPCPRRRGRQRSGGWPGQAYRSAARRPRRSSPRDLRVPVRRSSPAHHLRARPPWQRGRPHLPPHRPPLPHARRRLPRRPDRPHRRRPPSPARGRSIPTRASLPPQRQSPPTAPAACSRPAAVHRPRQRLRSQRPRQPVAPVRPSPRPRSNCCPRPRRNNGPAGSSMSRRAALGCSIVVSHRWRP